MNEPQLDHDELIRKIESLAPWHLDIQLTSELSTGQIFSSEGPILDREKNAGISLIAKHDSFLAAIDAIYPESLTGKTLLDCACNAGGFCFWARERDVKHALGFDVRDHWIQQARFIQQNRTVESTDRIQFIQEDLLQLPGHGLAPFSITTFTGIMDHLPDPITGLKIVADLTAEVMIVNSFIAWGEPDGYLKIGEERDDELMGGIHKLKWMPTGPGVLAKMLKWMGFRKTKLRYHHQSHFDPRYGVAEIFASRFDNQLDNLIGEYI